MKKKSIATRIYEIIAKPLAVLIGYVCYDPKYLKGKFYTKGLSKGWRWVLRCFFMQKIIGINRSVPFPVIFTTNVANWKYIHFDLDNMNIFQKSGLYLQAAGAEITLGKNVAIANNVGIITTNHDLLNPDVHVEGKPVSIGDHCWLGFGSIVLPGVALGPHTVVGAGSVVTKSFPEGYCVLVGNPARKIKNLRQDNPMPPSIET